MNLLNFVVVTSFLSRSENGCLQINFLKFYFLFLFQALIAVLPQTQMKYFDFENKTWKTLPASIPSIESTCCHSAVSVGNTLFVAGVAPNGSYSLFRYNTESNAWDMKLPLSWGGSIDNLCIMDDYVYVINSLPNHVPQRYNLAKSLWQSFSNVVNPSFELLACNSGVIVNEKIFVLYSYKPDRRGFNRPAVLQCFDPTKNEWYEKATTCHPHFGSTLFLVNDKLFIAGGRMGFINNCLCGSPAPVEVYNEDTNTWSVVEQKRIPFNNLNAVEIEGRVYFIINKFPVDSGIRIPPGELYPVPLGEWEDLGKIEQSAVLCHLPLKRECIKTE